jgi:hypothetical protein
MESVVDVDVDVVGSCEDCNVLFSADRGERASGAAMSRFEAFERRASGLSMDAAREREAEERARASARFVGWFPQLDLGWTGRRC